jgi:hypothetical protein
MPSDELDKLIVERFESSRQTIHAEYLEHTKHLLKRQVIVPNLGMLEKKILVFPSDGTDAHWTVMFVFNASYIPHNINEVDSGWLQPCFLQYSSLVTDGSQYALTEEDIPWFLNFCYSYELHDSSSSKERLLGTRNFTAFRLCNRSHFHHQKDSFNCDVGAFAGIAIILRNFLQNEDKVSWFDSRSRRGKHSMVFMKDETTQKIYMLSPEDFFEPVSTEDDLVWGNYLDCL